METENYTYLDYNSCGIILPKVREGIEKLLDHPLNPSSIHYLGQKASGYLEETRNTIKEYFHCDKTHDVIFFSTGSEANNFAINNCKFNSKENFDLWICSAGEHKSIIYPIKNKTNYCIIDITQDGILNEEQLYDILKKNKNKKIFFSLIYVNNETGAINPLRRIIENCRNLHENVVIHSDFGQVIGKLKIENSEDPININLLDLDLITIIGYKFGAMVGASALIHKKNLVFISNIVGGGQESGLRAGTENVLAIYSIKLAIQNQLFYITELRDYFEQTLREIIAKEDLIIFSEKVNRIGNTSYFTIKNLPSKVQLIYFNQHRIYLGNGSACSAGIDENSDVLEAMGYTPEIRKCAVRISLGYKNTKEDIKILIDKIGDLYKKFKK